jgi:diguanylate cyclase (GGDEF)-like protein/PAS domain S-box-containing protein
MPIYKHEPFEGRPRWDSAAILPPGSGLHIHMGMKPSALADEMKTSRLVKSCCVLVFLLLPMLAISQVQDSSARLRTLRTVSAVFSLSKAEAGKAYPIELDAIVLYSDPEWGSLFVQDQTGPTFIDIHGISTKFATGTRVRVDAVTGSNEIGPTVAHPKIVVLGRGELPRPEHKSVAELDGGADESFLAVTEGRLHPCERGFFRVCFRLFDGTKAIWLFVPQPESSAAQGLVGAVVRTSGVVARHVNDAGERPGAQLWVNSLDDIKVVEPPAAVGFSSPPTPIHELRASQADERFPGQMHLRGTVIWQSPGLFFIQDTSGMVFVGTRKDVAVHIGSTVDAIGFLSHGPFGLELADSVVNPSAIQSNVAAIAPLELTAAEVVKRSLNGRRVHLQARLISRSVNTTEFVYQLESGGQRFNAVLVRSDSAREMVVLAPGSLLDLTGVALTRSGTPERLESLVVLIDSPADMVVRGGFAWLTFRNGQFILGGIAFCVIAPLIWGTMLRRTVRRQTGIIRSRLQSELRMESKFRRLVERNLAGVFTWRPDGTIVECNLAFAKMLGFESREDLIGRSYWDFQLDPAHREQLSGALQEGALSNWEASLLRSDGATVHLLKNITPVETAQGMVYETTAIDVTQLRENQAELQRAKDKAVYDSLNDPLTGLPNRRLLLDRLSFLLEKAKRDGGMIALLYIDLDGFKLVNDSLGHPIGDAVLVEIAKGLRSRVRRSDVLARIGGDEFMVILDGLHAREEAALVAESFLQAISNSLQIQGHELTLGASIGISIYPEDSADAEELIKQADSAMYTAKRDGRNCVLYFTSAIGTEVQERLSLENQLRGAIARHEIFVHYQPEFELAGNKLVRFEALARWTHPTLGQIPPDKFIPVAEESGLISSLGAYIMEQACMEAVRWQKRVSYPIQVAVNVSTIQFRRRGFVEEVRMILERTGLSPQLLQIELTESVMLSGAHFTAETMGALRSLGVGMAIDDFGTGYSNLSYLPSMAFDALKIDRSFILNLKKMPESESMIRTLVALARNIGMRVIVEGIEEPDQLELIRSLGANDVQGYLMGRPTSNPIDAFLSPVDAVEELAK